MTAKQYRVCLQADEDRCVGYRPSSHDLVLVAGGAELEDDDHDDDGIAALVLDSPATAAHKAQQIFNEFRFNASHCVSPATFVLSSESCVGSGGAWHLNANNFFVKDAAGTKYCLAVMGSDCASTAFPGKCAPVSGVTSSPPLGAIIQPIKQCGKSQRFVLVDFATSSDDGNSHPPTTPPPTKEDDGGKTEDEGDVVTGEAFDPWVFISQITLVMWIMAGTALFVLVAGCWLRRRRAGGGRGGGGGSTSGSSRRVIDSWEATNAAATGIEATPMRRAVAPDPPSFSKNPFGIRFDEISNAAFNQLRYHTRVAGSAAVSPEASYTAFDGTSHSSRNGRVQHGEPLSPVDVAPTASSSSGRGRGRDGRFDEVVIT